MLTRLLLLLSLTVFTATLRAADPAPPTESKVLTDHTPSLSIIEALKVAQEYLADKHLDLSTHFISGVRFFDSGSKAETSGKGPYWLVTYEPKVSSDGGRYFIHVYMNREAGHVGGR